MTIFRNLLLTYQPICQTFPTFLLLTFQMTLWAQDDLKLQLKKDSGGESGEVVLSWSAEAGASYLLYAARQISGPWEMLSGSPIVSTDTIVQYEALVLEDAMQFFRVSRIVDQFDIESIGARMIWVSPGKFIMGSPATEPGRYPPESPQHTVTLTKGYWLGQTEVTQAQWAALMGSNPSYFTGNDQLPVERVSWEDCQEFCRRLTESERQAGRISSSMSYTFPTEAQWEYACRAGTTGMTWLGNFTIDGDGPSALLGQIAWYAHNSNSRTHPVAIKPANPWGFHDMLGNVAEWCSDWYGNYPNGPVTDPRGPSSGRSRVARGGSRLSYPRSCRAAGREWFTPTFGGLNYYGFRLALQTGE